MPNRHVKPLTLTAVLCAALAMASGCHAQSATMRADRGAASEPGAAPATPAAVAEIVAVQPFRLREGYRYTWLKEAPVVSAGVLVVLKVDPAYVTPRNAGEPVLFAGDVTVQRLNQGHRSGHVVGIIPGEVDLAAAPVWFGRPQLPERVTPEIIRDERALADKTGVKAFSAAAIDGARLDPVEADTLADLLRGPAGDLVLRYAPDEKDLVAAWRLPVAGSRPN